MSDGRKPYVFDPEACWEAYYEIFPEDRPKPKVTLQPKPKPSQVPEQPIEVARRVAQQTVEQLARREKEEADRAEREAERIADEERRRQWMVAQRQAAIDACWSRQLAEREIALRWDPQGLWGAATLASELD